MQGLLVGSNFRLAELSLEEEGGKSDVWLHGGALPPNLDIAKLQRGAADYETPLRNQQGEPYSRMWRCARTGIYYFRFIEGFSCAIDSEGNNVWIEWSDSVSVDVITAFLLGRIFAFVLHLRGHLCLHASAVAVDGRAILFAGNPGAGKSSTAAAFTQRGHPLLSDDVSAIRREPDGRMVVVPAVPRACLLPDAIEFLYGPRSVGQLPRLLPSDDKRIVRLDSAPGKFQTEPVQLGAIYLLARRAPGRAGPRIEAVAGAERLVRLLCNGFMALALGKEQTAREFPILGEVAQTVPIQELVPSDDPGRLGEMCELIVNDVRGCGTFPAGSPR